MSKKKDKKRVKVSAPALMASSPEPTAYNNVWSVSFDGEKNIGNIGPIKKYIVDHEALRLRSWQLFLESEICQLVFQRSSTWVIGSGLKLQAEPQTEVLESEDIDLDIEAFNRRIESRWKVYTRSTMADYADMVTHAEIAKQAWINSIISGDVLIVNRYENGQVTQQLIDGCHISTPLVGNGTQFNGFDFVSSFGNRIKHGVEVDERGTHVAYWVKTGLMKYERIIARGKSGHLMAYMVYGLKYRLDSVRGLPLIAAVMETASKLERYKEATLGSAEEAAKVAFITTHGPASTGENPALKGLMSASGFNKPASGDNPVDVNGKYVLNQVQATLGKQSINMPIDSKLEVLESEKEIHFADFYTPNIHLVCATIEIPPEVALQKYDSNFSSSRAALKDWEHTLLTKRHYFALSFYQLFYNLWLELEILNNKVQAPGYLMARQSGNRLIIEAYRYARWIGPNVPHIDPLKEANAERVKLGAAGKDLPLTTLEASTESLNGGDAISNIRQYAKELEEAKKMKITSAQKQTIKEKATD